MKFKITEIYEKVVEANSLEELNLLHATSDLFEAEDLKSFYINYVEERSK
jgi:hypothetical protein